MGAVTLDLAGYEVAGDDTASLAVLDDDVEHLMTRVALDRACCDLLVECGVCAEQQLLSGLAAGIERTRYLRTAERTVSQQAAVLAGEGYALSHALVDDEVRYLGQTVYVGLACAVVASLDGIVEEAVYRVVIVLIVLRSVDTALSCDRVGAARRVLNAEHLDVISEFSERSGSRCATEARTYDYDVELALVGGAHDFDGRLVVAPLLSQLAGGDFRI